MRSGGSVGLVFQNLTKNLTKLFSLVPYSARHTYGTYTMEKSRNAFAVAKSMGHVDLKPMEPYQHQELEPLREIINQRNQRKKFGQVFGQVLEKEGNKAIGAQSVSN